MREELLDILSYRREHDTIGEKSFCQKYMSSFEEVFNRKGEVIAYRYENNLANAKTKILWTSHVDTVHSDISFDRNYNSKWSWSNDYAVTDKPKQKSKKGEIKQTVYVDDMTNHAFVDSTCDCLGADDGTGIWLMLNMIRNNVHGTYLFFRGEEQGCIGSSDMADEHREYLEEFDCAIAFDRKGNDSIITHQRSSRCCSKSFGKSLQNAFKGHIDFKLDDTGVYTDTAEFMHLIPEITNLSVGYQSQHTSSETQDLDFADKLLNALLDIQWHEIDLAIERKPEHPKSNYGGVMTWGYRDYYGGNTAYTSDYDDYVYITKHECEQKLSSMTMGEIADLVQDMAIHIEELEERRMAFEEEWGYDC